MNSFLLKVLLSAFLVAAISELARRSTFAGALLASLPLTSILAMIWLYYETHDLPRIGAFANSIFWLVLPSLALFLVMPWMLRLGYSFWSGLSGGILATLVAYGVTAIALGMHSQN